MMKNFFKYLVLNIAILSQVHFAYAQSTTASILPPAKTTFFDNNGKPLSSGTIDFYIPGTTTRKTTWKDGGQTVPNTNPVVLDSSGRGLILGDGSYRQVVKDKNGNTIWDQVTSSTGSGGGGTTPTVGDGDAVGTIKAWAGFTAPYGYAFTYGQEIVRTSFPEAFAAITSQQNVSCTSGSPTLTGVGATSQLPIGAPIESSCLNSGATIVSKTSSTVTVSSNAIISTTTTARFFPFGNGNGTDTFNLPDLRGRVIAGNDIMGGIAANRLTSTYFGTTADAVGANGGSQSQVLTVANLPSTPPTFSGTGATISVNTTVSTVSFGGTGNSATTGSDFNVRGGQAIGTINSTGTFVPSGTISGGSDTPIATIQPTQTQNYIIKIIPDTNPNSFFGVASIGGMYGVIECGFGITCAGNTISAVNSSLPTPTPTTLGGVFSSTCSTSNWFSSLDETGAFGCSQPSFADLTGAIANSQISDNSVPYNKLVNGTGLSVIGVSGNTATANADIVASTDNQVLRRSGASIGFGAINLASSNAVSGVLGNSNLPLASNSNLGIAQCDGTTITCASGVMTSVGGGAGLGTQGYALIGNGASPSTYQGYVGYGTGATTRTWNAKAQDVFSVVDYGAVADSGTAAGTDNSAAFNAAVQAAYDYSQSVAGHSPSGTVYVPPGAGCYRIHSATINLLKGVNIIGAGGQASCIIADDVDAITLNFIAGFGQQIIRGLYIIGENSTAGRYAVYRPGSTTDADIQYGLNIDSNLIYGFNTAIDLRTLQNLWITNNWIQNVNQCMAFHGFVAVGKIQGNNCIRADGGGTGGGTFAGIGLYSFNYTTGSGVISPEGIEMSMNQIFGFNIGVDHANGVFIAFSNNDISATVDGYKFADTRGGLYINNNYIALNNVAGAHGIYGTGIATAQDSQVNIYSNTLIATTTVGANGIQINDSGLGNQNNINIVRNLFDGFNANDILVYSAVQVNIDNNRLRSSSTTNSISMTSVAGGTSFVTNNEAARSIALSSSDTANGAVIRANNIVAGVRDNSCGVWVQTPFSASNFTGNGAMTWTVAAGNIQTNEYNICGNKMTVSLVVSGTTIGGTLDSQLQMTIPAGKTANNRALNATGLILDNSVRTAGYFDIAASGTKIAISKLDGTNWVATPLVYGQITFDIQ